MGTRLWTPWDTVALVGYEAVAIPVAFLVRGAWQIPVFLAGLLTLAAIGRLFLGLTPRGARLRAKIPRGTRSAPFLLAALAAVGAMVAISLVLRVLGAGHADGWLIMSVGGVNPAVNVSDRWWTARVGTAT